MLTKLFVGTRSVFLFVLLVSDNGWTSCIKCEHTAGSLDIELFVVRQPYFRCRKILRLPHSVVIIRHLIDRDTATTLACLIVASRLDYCNSVLNGVTYANIAKLQRVQNSLARAVCKLPCGAPVTGMLLDLHWLPLKHQFT